MCNLHIMNENIDVSQETTDLSALEDDFFYLTVLKFGTIAAVSMQ